MPADVSTTSTSRSNVARPAHDHVLQRAAAVEHMGEIRSGPQTQQHIDIGEPQIGVHGGDSEDEMRVPVVVRSALRS